MTSLPEGDFKAEITLSGGTGRTTVQSPADVHIENGIITAEIVWSSSSYDLMIADGKQYTPDSMEGGSRFTVVIPALDVPLEIQAETIAMNAPHLIDYTITLSSEEIITGEDAVSSEDSASAAADSIDVSANLSSLLESLQAKLDSASETGSTIEVFSAVVGAPEKTADIPPVAIVAISAVLGAVIAFVAITIGKKKNGK